MVLAKDVGKIIPGMMSLAVAGRAAQLIPNEKSMKGSMKGKNKEVSSMKQSKKMVKGFTDIMIGTSMIGPTAGMIDAL